MTTCESQSENLSALADGELTGWSAWRLRRHVAHCPACAGELADWQRMNSALGAADVVPAGSPSAARLPLGTNAASFWSRRLLVPGLISVAAVAGIVAFASFAPGQPGNPTIAYAEVSQAMQKVKTAQWTMKRTSFDRTGVKDSESTTQIYEQSEPLRILRRVHYQSPTESDWGASRGEMTTLITSQGTQDYSPSSREIVVRPAATINKRGDELFQEQLSFLSAMTRESDTPKQGRSVATEKTVFEGRPALCLTMKGFALSDERERFEYRFWADAATKRVLRTEDKIITNSTGRVETATITEGYRYDEPLGDTAFALGAPAGTSTYQVDDPRLRITPGERASAERLIAQTYKGLGHGDWRQFAAGWDFDFAAALPQSDVAPGQQEAYLQRMVDAARGKYWTYGAKIGPIGYSPAVQIMGYGLASLPPGDKPVLCVRTTASVLHRDGFENGGVELFYIRTTGPNAPRIVGWQIAFQREREADHKRWLKNGHHW